MRIFRVVILGLFCLLTKPIMAAETSGSESLDSEQLELESYSSLPFVIEDGWHFCPVQNFQPDVDTAVLDCHPITLPSGWETNVPDYDGYGLLYTYFTISDTLSGTSLGLAIKRIRDADKIFINGQFIGQTGEFPPNFDKAVLYSRLYAIPAEAIKFNQKNLLSIWVYNDARPGGITQTLPVIDNYFELVRIHYHNNLKSFAFVVILCMFAVLHFIYFIFRRQSSENLYYGVFLLCWSAYIFTLSDLPVSDGTSLSLLFRINVSLFYLIFSLFPLFIYQFFQQKIPLPVKVIMGISISVIPFCFLLPEPKLLYYPLEFVELLTIPALLYIYHLLFKAIRAQLAYAKLMCVVILLYTSFGFVDILIDFTQSESLQKISLFGPWGLLLLSLALTLIMAHKNLVYYKDATVDRLTNALRHTEFISRLELEVFRADRESHPIVVVMVDLDDFKLINDKFGHIQGDKILTKVSESLRSQLRHFDLLGRYGGDEFCIAAILESPNEIRSFVKRLHQSVNKITFERGGEEHQISVTFGAVIRNTSGESSPQSLVEKADALLIEAKSNAKGTILW